MRTFLFLTLLFLFTRLFFLFGFDLSREAKFKEEKFQGMITYEWIKGPNLPMVDYKSSTWMAGAEKVMALWEIPFFLLLGPNLFALHLASVAWSFLIFLLIYFFVKRHFSTRQAVWASLFFIFAPPGLILMSLTAIGYHFQSTLFVLGFLFLFYEHHFGFLKRTWSLFLEGLLLGIGIYFSLEVLLTLFAFFIFSLILERRLFFRPSTLLFLLGLLIGYAPGFYEGFSNAFQQFLVYNQPVYEHFLRTGFQEKFILPLRRFIWLSVRFFPQGLRFERSGLLASLLAWGWYGLAVFSFWTLFRKGTRRIHLILLYAAFIPLVFVWSSFHLEHYWYYSPLLVFFCILLGLHWGAADQKGPRQWLRAAGLGVCLIGWIPYLTMPRTSQAFQEKAFSYACLRAGLGWARRVFGISISKENLKSLTETGHRSLDPRFLPVFERVIGSIACYGASESGLAGDLALVDEAEAEINHRANFYHQWGYCLACNLREKPDIQTLLDRIEKLPSGRREALAAGAGECVFQWKPSLKLEPPAGVHDDFYRGAGMAFGTLFEDAFEKGVERILEFPEALRPVFFEGFGKGTYWWDGGGGEITGTLKDKVPLPYQTHFQKGLASAGYGGM